MKDRLEAGTSAGRGRDDVAFGESAPFEKRLPHFMLQCRPAGTGEGSRDAAAEYQHGIGRVDDKIRLFLLQKITLFDMYVKSHLPIVTLCCLYGEKGRQRSSCKNVKWILFNMILCFF
jgi:hypothetical protein